MDNRQELTDGFNEYIEGKAPEGMWYILDDKKNPIGCRDRKTIAEWMEPPPFNKRKNKNRRVNGGRYIRSTKAFDGKDFYWISTVFLMLENMGGMFETLVFKKIDGEYRSTDYMYRNHTYQDSVKFHKKLIRKIRQRKLKIDKE